VIVVSGTGRSGTSLCLQALEAAGVPVLGERFPLDREQRYAAANPQGFYESLLIQGIHFETNPDPSTGLELVPEQVQGWAVKVFSFGLRRSERRFIERALLCVRGWRGFRASLIAMGEGQGLVTDIDPALWWARELVATLEDALSRRYPIEIVRFEEVVADRSAMASSLSWLGPEASARGAEVVELRQRVRLEVPEGLHSCAGDLNDLDDLLTHGLRPGWPLLRRLRAIRARLPDT
jgi:hypothetical protein